MADDIKVTPTPIQRNPLDVATELTQLYFDKCSIRTIDDIQEVFLKFYSVAKTADSLFVKHLNRYLPKEMQKIVNEAFPH